jgi:hypothetical protein
MKQTGEYFTDMVSWDIVHYWVDCYGDKWMAVNKWGFRVKTK